MTNQNNTSQNRPFQRDQLKREVVDKLVAQRERRA